MRCRHILAGWVLLAMAAPAPPGAASELVYHPIDPAFGGNPFNGPFLLGTAEANNEYVAKRKPRPQLSAQERFARTMQSRLLSAVASRVSDAIFGEDAQDEGSFRFGDQVINFTRGAENLTIDLINEATGERTRISLPNLSVEP
jgi:curli production assembly/transport component CsgF